ncbi:LysE family transporter [Paracidovorax oryzae]|uniref:LysE family transporter n=1 Tax=Paracidovorax oryzae TaxID=862720 RepID=UPI00047DF2D2|nr:LysE family transporter [Paracidovorax oryzae]
MWWTTSFLQGLGTGAGLQRRHVALTAWTCIAVDAGAIAASTAWFLSLGFGARLLSPWFARPSAWRALDAFVAAVTLSLAAFLAFAPLPSAP